MSWMQSRLVVAFSYFALQSTLYELVLIALLDAMLCLAMWICSELAGMGLCDHLYEDVGCTYGSNWSM